MKFLPGDGEKSPVPPDPGRLVWTNCINFNDAFVRNVKKQRRLGGAVKLYLIISIKNPIINIVSKLAMLEFAKDSHAVPMPPGIDGEDRAIY